jgi:cobalt-zinc-cadmium efflux system membrane fusion protein
MKTGRVILLAVAALFAAVALYLVKDRFLTRAAVPPGATTTAAGAAPSVEVSEKQAEALKVGPVEERVFPLEKEAIGSIDFNEEMTVPVFSPYQGRIIEALARVGEEVVKGQTLFTVDSPDLLQATSTLISTAGTSELTTRALTRLRDLVKTKAAAQKDLDQAISDQQAAEGAHKAARDAVRIFGKSEDEINRMVAERRVDPILVVPSPISGRITARNAAPGLLVQPSSTPAPYAVADISTMWMLANVAEAESPLYRVGQEVKAKVLAYAERVFEGKIETIGAAVDPTTHRVLVRSAIADPRHELRPGMFATFVIEIGAPMRALAIPVNGIVREGDGTMIAWVTTDRRRFVPRVVKTGVQRDGYFQILEGVERGELVATDGAIFLSNAATTAQR